MFRKHTLADDKADLRVIKEIFLKGTMYMYTYVHEGVASLVCFKFHEFHAYIHVHVHAHVLGAFILL